MKIAVEGTGYVGLSMAILLAQNNEVTAVDSTEKISLPIRLLPKSQRLSVCID